ncbi:MAG TPA: 50S ribosomal protein L6 [Thermoplasmata archaeon]|nr:50S ribosomal protein L6 [Thermoplasmata archaeon]
MPTSTEARAPVLTAVDVPLPPGTTLKVAGSDLVVKGPAGELRRPFPTDALQVTPGKSSVRIALKIPPNRKKAKALLNTWERHAMNLLTGVTRGFEAKLKSVAAHFPMKLAVKEHTLVIENFLGEKHPRGAEILPSVTASVEGEFVVLRGPSIEDVGRAAATIERATHIRDYDPRVFQDGIYIVERAHPRESS